MSAELRREIDERVARGDAAGAFARLGRLWRAEPNSATAAFVVKRFEAIRDALPRTRARVAILRSFTVEPVVPLLRAEAAVGGLDLDVHVGEFNAHVQEILDPESPLYRFEPDVVFLAVQSRDVAPELWSGDADLQPAARDACVERVLEELRLQVDTLRERSAAHVVVHGLERPSPPPTGLLGAQEESPIARINRGLRELLAERRGTWLLDYGALVARHGRERWHDERRWLTMRAPVSADCVIHLAREWLRFLHPLTGRVCKVLVCDLDNTLWGGVVGEEGMDGIRLGVEYPGAAYRDLQRACLDLHRRGVLLAVASKNNPDDALQVLEGHPQMLLRPEHFAALRIDWTEKAHNLRAIAEELNIGVDALAFLDDNPAEREWVRSELPEVWVVELGDDPMGFARTLRDQPVFERLKLSEEDRDRGRMYAAQRQRESSRRAAGSLEDFLRSLEMKARIARVTPATVPRTAQLTQKTNQFNLTTRRYSEQEIAEMARRPDHRVWCVRVTDRFGDNGIVGVMIARHAGPVCEIDTFLMSCRVIGRTVERAMLATLAEDARRAGAERLSGWFLPTRKNAPARDFYPKHGFESAEERDEGVRYELDLRAHGVEAPEWIERHLEDGGDS